MAIVDIYGGAPTHLLEGPYIGAFAITKSDDDDLPQVTRAIYVGGAGDLAVQLMIGGTVTFKAPPVGTVLRIRAKRVMAATTCTLLIGLY